MSQRGAGVAAAGADGVGDTGVRQLTGSACQTWDLVLQCERFL